MMREGLYAIGLEPSTTPFGATRTSSRRATR